MDFLEVMNDNLNLIRVMEKDKSRGIKHRKDKQKYRGNTKKDPKHVPTKSKRNLESNWDRYEKEDVQDFQLDSSTDFSILANTPIVQGHHFQFKSDKLIAEETESRVSNQLFSLDLSMLKCSILTVPFYQRVGIEQEYFVENQIKFMNRDAEDNLIKYNEKYKDKARVEKPLDPVCIDSIEDQSASNIDDNLAKVEEADADNLSEVITKMDDVVKLAEMTQKNPEDDLEQWLDDILDD